MVTLGRWEIRTAPEQRATSYVIRILPLEPVEPFVATAEDLEKAVANFIARHVLEKESFIFEG